VLTAIVVVLHTLISLLLVLLVLLHSGKGGGLSDMFGGGLGATAAGSTVMEKNLDRLTLVTAILFGMSTFGLALILD
jgi:preprotein translocase subunit SecG